jgi:hypothetical protein
MKNITRKLKNMGTTIGLGVCSFWALGNSGCQTINPQGEAFLMGLGQAAIYTGVTESVKARVNPNETNVNIYGNQNQQPQIIIPEHVVGGEGKYMPDEGYTWVNPEDKSDLRVRKMSEDEILKEKYNSNQNIFFTCNYSNDFNKNEIFEFEDNINIKNSFKENESITAVGTIHKNLNGKTIEKRLIDFNGRVISFEKDFMGDEYVNGCVATFKVPEKLSPGDYIVTFSVDKEYLGRVEFKVEE